MTSLSKSPFANSASAPGVGNIVLSLLPPGKQVLTSCTFQYPLKLIAPDPHRSSDDKHVTVVFLLTYGGGLVGGDKINLDVTVNDLTRLILVTQGSTKIFKSAERSVISGQTLNVSVGVGAAVCYLPDPTQPFAESVYEQKQIFRVDPQGQSSLLVLDWVTEGRRARGESWHFWKWEGRNEVREHASEGRGRLLLRDAVLLDDHNFGKTTLGDRTNDLGILGTLIVYGPTFHKLSEFLMREFQNLPRIGGQQWTNRDSGDAETSPSETEARRSKERQSGLLWTVANVRGFVLVKFGARDLEGARRWLGDLLKREGSVEQYFGHQALFCLR